jgi:hypothetical protein
MSIHLMVSYRPQGSVYLNSFLSISQKEIFHFPIFNIANSFFLPIHICLWFLLVYFSFQLLYFSALYFLFLYFLLFNISILLIHCLLILFISFVLKTSLIYWIFQQCLLGIFILNGSFLVVCLYVCELLLQTGHLNIQIIVTLCLGFFSCKAEIQSRLFLDFWHILYFS